MSISIGSAAAARSREAVQSQMEDINLSTKQKKQICLAALEKGTIGKEEAARMLMKIGVPMMEALNLSENTGKEEIPNLNQAGAAKSAWDNARGQIGKIFGNMFTKKAE